jgi:RES domain-containing protein
VRVWRICRRRHRPFDGEGARLIGGRWNHPGTALVYTSGSLALATLELLVHVDTDLAPPGLVAVAAEVPDDLIEILDSAKLPKNWRKYPAPEELKDLGTGWIKRGSSAVLAVPSAVVPSERNYLINPKHADFARIAIAPPVPFEFDPRLWK